MSSPELLGFPRLRFLTSDFCPFAQRARIVLEWFKMPFELIEALSLPEGTDQYEKHPLLVEKNPKGLIPTLLVDWSAGSEEVVTDSLSVVEYIDGLAARFGMAQAPLVPRDDKLERDRILEKASFYNENIASPFYAVLMRGDKGAFDTLVQGSEEFLSEMKGPFYNGQTMCIVDIAVYPWILRAFLLAYYKGPTFSISPRDQPQLSGLYEWYEKMSAVEAVKTTVMSRDYYIKAYDRYASGKASSQFPKIQFLTLRFCPFAHRARLALEALQIPYDLVEVIHLPEGATEYKKDALLLEHNPQGLVPVLIVKFPDGKEETVTESLYCVEYLDKLAEKYGLKAAPLLPRDDEAEKKRLIETADKYGSAIGAFYKPFMTNDKDALGPLVEELKKFSDEVKGPFFTGKDLSIVDIAIYPAVSRLSLLRQLRGPDFEVSVEKYPQLGPLFEWFKNVSELDAAKKADESEDYLTTMNRRYLRMRGAVGYTA